MTTDNRVVYLDTSVQARRSSGRELYDELRQLACNRLQALLQHMLDQADDALFEMAEKSFSITEQTQYFDAMRQVRLCRRELEEAFHRELLARFRGLLQRTEARSASTGSADELTLLDSAALEQGLAVDGMIGKARARLGASCAQLQLRLGALLSEYEVDESSNPLDPQQICKAFAAAAELLELEIEARLIILKLFDRHVMSQLAGLFEEANRFLIERGVLPTQRDLSQAGRRYATARVETPAPAEETPASSAVVELLHQLVAQQKQGSRWTGTGYSGPVAPLGDVVSALSVLQDGRLAEASSEEGLKVVLGRMLHRDGDARVLGHAEDNVIDIVAMLFDAILGDDSLAAPVKALIGRLQIPVLKVALLDASFFSSRRHPARELINELARAALGWVEPAHVDRDPLFTTMQRSVARILEEFDEDVALFEDVLQDFRIFLAEERARIELIEERTRQAAEGKAKVDRAKALVEAEITARLRIHEPPEVVSRLLHAGWAKVLFIACLKEGSEGEGYLRQLEVMDRLLWSVEPKTDESERKELLKAIPQLLGDLREGLGGILYNPFEMTKLFEALEQEHLKCLNGAAPEREPAPAVAALEPAPTLELAQPQHGPEPEIAEQTLAQLREVVPGAWFELTLPGGARTRAKLSARLGGGERLIFVNRSGFKVADKRLAELAAELEAGEAALLDDNVLFDKALEAVITNLREMRETHA